MEGPFMGHEADMPSVLRDVRFQGQSRKHSPALSFSDLEPKQTLGVIRRLANFAARWAVR